MRLARWSMTNYRAFDEVEVTIAPNGLTFLVGANNVGKSSLLTGIKDFALTNAVSRTSFHAGKPRA